MRSRTILAGLGLFPTLMLQVLADNHRVEFDKYSDFSTLKTFALREGKVNSPKPELNNTLTLRKVGDAIRAQLLAKGLKETSNQPDIVVDYSITSTDYAAQRGGPASYSEGTIVVDLMDRSLGALVWHGVYRDDEKNTIKLAEKFPRDVAQLFSEYPPRQQKPIPPRPPSQVRSPVPMSPKQASAAAIEIIRYIRNDTSYVGQSAHPGLNISLNLLERAAKAVADDDGKNSAATATKINAFQKAVNDTATFAMGIAENDRQSPNAKQRSVELVSRLRALSGS